MGLCDKGRCVEKIAHDRQEMGAAGPLMTPRLIASSAKPRKVQARIMDAPYQRSQVSRSSRFLDFPGCSAPRKASIHVMACMH
jgi:hypothetical protein